MVWCSVFLHHQITTTPHICCGLKNIQVRRKIGMHAHTQNSYAHRHQINEHAMLLLRSGVTMGFLSFCKATASTP